ncbi:MAG: trypsin-like peptidase domain-containing protein [Oscillospiraceae bacterium]|nr:trypsin-like peptidase domain-containing protein [Oscillospiraceae bacterium]
MDTFENKPVSEPVEAEQPVTAAQEPAPARPGFYQPQPLDGSVANGPEHEPRPFPRPGYSVPYPQMNYGYPGSGYAPPRGYMPPQGYMPPMGYAPPIPPVPPRNAPPVPPQPKPEAAPPVPEATPKKERKVLKTICACLVVVGLITTGCVITGAVVRNQYHQEVVNLKKNFDDRLKAYEESIADLRPEADGNSSSGTPNTSPEGLTPGQVYAQNVDSVVAINCEVSTSYGVGTSSGSGFVWTSDGYIVSNYHVVDGATAIKVVTHNGKEYEATYVGGDASNDIALLKVTTEDDLQAVTIGSSSKLIVGDLVEAVGNALGELSSTMTVGYVSAIDRIVTTEGSQINMIQTDAAINSGNSGGPLFNMKGEVVGIISAKYSGTTSSGATIEGIGFAIPMDDVIGMLEDLKEFGYVTGGYLGVTVSDMDPTDAQQYGLPMGVLVHSVTNGTCAQKGGIKAQDIIVELGGYEITNMNDLTRALRKFDGGDEVSVVVYRASQGGEVILTLTLDSKPAADAATPDPAPEQGTTDDWFDHFFG